MKEFNMTTASEPDQTGCETGPHASQPPLADELLIDAETDEGPPPHRAHPFALALGLVLVALNLRPALSSIGSVLPDIVRDLDLSATTASLLTMIPVLCLGIFGLAAPGMARRLGTERAVLVTLALLAAGILLRLVPNLVALFVSTIMAGAGIGIVGVLLPGLVKRDFAKRADLMTGVYTMALCGGAAAAAGLTVPLREAAGGQWTTALAFWAVPAIIAVLAWLPFVPRRQDGAVRGHYVVTGLWRDPLAWQVTLFMGLQSSLAYIVFGWLAPILRDRGLDPTVAGLVVSTSIMVQLPTALVGPMLATRFRNQGVAAAIMLGLTIAGLLGAVHGPLGTVWVWAVLLGLGQGGNFAVALALIVLRAADSHVAAKLSSMAQSVGYMLASIGPLLVGLLHDWTGGWTAASMLLVIVTVLALICGLLAGRDKHVKAVSKAAS